MKVNLKKIGAIVAGATILASTAAFGALWFENTQLVNENGAPVAKVVVGENAAASDGVAAALIAGKLVNSAYKTATLSGQLVGTPTCTATGEGGGACTISDEKAQLEIKVPGAVAEGTYTFNTLIGDFVNRKLLDRVANTADDTNAAYLMTASDTVDYSNPFTTNNNPGLANLGSGEVYFYRVDGSMFSPLATTTVRDDDTAKTYSESQFIWIKGDAKYNKDEKEVVGDVGMLVYSIKFGGAGNDYGIPVCTTPTNSNYAYCKYGEDEALADYATETHKVRINFLGEPWVISEMAPPDGDAGDLTNDNWLTNGGYIKLAKESVSGILNQGESLPVDGYKFHLDDLEAHGDEGVSAIISVLDANDNIIKKDKVGPGQTKEFNIEGKTYRFHVYKVAPGYTYGAKWADVAIYSQELMLEDGKDLDADKEKNEHYTVALGWKNKDATNAGTVCNRADKGDDGRRCADHLRTIIVYSEEVDDLTSGGEDYLLKGDYVPIVQDPVAWKLSFLGLDLTSADKQTLTYKLVVDSPKTISKGLMWNPTTTVKTCAIYPPYIEVTPGGRVSSDGATAYLAYNDTDADNYGELVGGTVEVSSDEKFYIAMNYDGDLGTYFGFTPGGGSSVPVSGLWCDGGDGTLDPTATGTDDVLLGDGVLMKYSSSQHAFIPAWSGAEWSTGVTQEAVALQYDKIGDGDHVLEGGGLLVVEPFDTLASSGEPFVCADSAGDKELENLTGVDYCGVSVPKIGTIPSYYFLIAEKAGEGTSDASTDYMLFGIDDSSKGPGIPVFDTATFKVDFVTAGGVHVTSDSGDELHYVYAGPVTAQYSTDLLESPLITERGSEFSSLSATEVKFKMAHKLGHAQFNLASAAANVSAESTCVATLAEGQDYTCAGVTVKVLEITEKGVCGAGAGACTGSTEGMSAKVVDQTGAEVTTAYIPYADAYRGLVILDRDAVGVSTLISVGGDRVNTITAGLLSGSPVDWSAPENRVVVREVVQGQKIVVAGKEADDTIEAANQFISRLRSA